MNNFIRKHKSVIILHIGQFLVGLIAYSGAYSSMPLSLLFFVFWFHAQRRIFAFTTTFLYFLGSIKELFWGSLVYYDNSIPFAIVVCIGSAAAASIPFGVFYFKNVSMRMVGILLALVFSILPPTSIATWTSPLVSTGIIFPGGGFLALFSLLVLIPLICRWPVVVALPTLMSLVIPPTDSNTPHDFLAINTEYQFDYERTYEPFGIIDYSHDYERLQKVIKTAQEAETKYMLFPESVGGVWTESNKELWSEYDSDSVVLLPSVIRTGDNKEGIVVKVSKDSKEVIYKQRMPVPVSMWWPGRQFSYLAHWFDNPVVEVEAKKIAFFICYEQLVSWTILHSAYRGADVFLASSNLWWAKDTKIDTLQGNIIRAWSELFGIPLVRAVNY